MGGSEGDWQSGGRSWGASAGVFDPSARKKTRRATYPQRRASAREASFLRLNYTANEISCNLVQVQHYADTLYASNIVWNSLEAASMDPILL
jgi:hypothetical protein